jgi:hypothetical protein
VNHSVLRTIFLASLILVMTNAHVASAQPTRFWTGADLYTDNRITLPTTVPTLNGTSLIFGPGGPEFGKLITYRIVPAAKGRDLLISVTMNLTRLTNDWDAQILLSDGNRMIGVSVSDFQGGPQGQLGQIVRADLGDRGIRVGTDGSLFTAPGFPAIGESIVATVTFLVSDTFTQVTGTMLGTTATFFDFPLNRDGRLEFVFMRDNDLGESYGVNSLAIEASVVPKHGQ